MTHEPKEIYRADSIQQAHVLKGFLEEHGIEALVVNDAQQIAGGELPLGWPSLARVVVPEEQAAKARALAMRFEAEWRGEGGPAEEPPPDEEERWLDWPVCPECGQRRQALCTICGTAGTDFPLMDIDRSGEQEQVLLYCPTCDDHFRPAFYRRCHACGYDYGEGVVPPGEKPAPRDVISPLGWLIVAAVLAALAGLIGYFAWLVS